MTHEPQDSDSSSVSRRQALKRMAAVGGAVWVAPALQTINMAKAKAGSPQEVCFSVRILPGNRCVSGGFSCIHPVAGTDGPSHVTVLSTSPGSSWVIDLGSCRFIEGSVRSGTTGNPCCPIGVASGRTGVITVDRCVTGSNGLLNISAVELTLCCST